MRAVCLIFLTLSVLNSCTVKKGKPPIRKWLRALLCVHWAVYFALAAFAVVFIGFIW